MKKIDFDGKEYIVRDWLELTGADWQQLADALSRLSTAPPDSAFGDILDELILLLAPDHLQESQSWGKESRIRFFNLTVPDLSPLNPVIERMTAAVERTRRKEFLERLSAWAAAQT